MIATLMSLMTSSGFSMPMNAGVVGFCYQSTMRPHSFTRHLSFCDRLEVNGGEVAKKTETIALLPTFCQCPVGDSGLSSEKSSIDWQECLCAMDCHL